MEEGFDYLRCPMCGGELIFSEGTHDLCCRNNLHERVNRDGGVRDAKAASALHEERAGYGAEAGGGAQSPWQSPLAESEDSGPDPNGRGLTRAESCEFAVSFTGSVTDGTLWSVRTVHGKTNYFSLIKLMEKIEKREKRGEPLAPNVPNLPRKPERSPVMKLAFRYGLHEEDVFSIRYSTESVRRLAAFYGLTEREIKSIKNAEVGEGG